MQVVSLAQLGELWWIITVEESKQGWDIKQFKPAKGRKSKSLERAKQSAKSRSLPFKEIEFSEAEMAAIASLIEPAINRKEQRQNQKERLKNEQKPRMQDADKVAPTPPLPPKDSQPVLSATPQALLEQIQHLLHQLAETQRDKGELAQEVKRLHQINQALNKQVSELQEEVRNLSPKRGKRKT